MWHQFGNYRENETGWLTSTPLSRSPSTPGGSPRCPSLPSNAARGQLKEEVAHA